MAVASVPSTEYPVTRLAEILTAGYEGYLVPFAVDEETLRPTVEVFEIDLSRSLVAADDGEPIGLAASAERTSRCSGRWAETWPLRDPRRTADEGSVSAANYPAGGGVTRAIRAAGGEVTAAPVRAGQAAVVGDVPLRR